MKYLLPFTDGPVLPVGNVSACVCKFVNVPIYIECNPVSRVFITIPTLKIYIPSSFSPSHY